MPTVTMDMKISWVVTRDAKRYGQCHGSHYPDCPNVSEWLPGMPAPSKIEESLVVSLWGMGISSHQSYSPHGLGWVLGFSTIKVVSWNHSPILKQTKLYQPWWSVIFPGIPMAAMLQGRAATGHFSCTSGAGRWASKSLGDSCSPHHTAEWSDVLEGVKTATWTACDGKTKGRLDGRRNFNERPVIHTYFLVLVVHMRDFKTLDSSVKRWKHQHGNE